MIIDSLQYVSSFVLKSLGGAYKVLKYTIIVLYLFSIPISCILTRKMKNLVGVWIGYGIGSCTMCILIHLSLYKIDWDEAINKRRI